MNYTYLFNIYRLLLTVGLTMLFAACDKNKEEVAPVGPIQLEFPNCQLIKVENTTSFGSLEVYNYSYENGKLVQVDFYVSNVFNSRKIFTYDTEGNLAYMLGHNDTLSNIKDTLVKYEFKDGLLVKDTHWSQEGEALSISEYSYENRFLKKMKVINNDHSGRQEGEYEVETDKKGNPIKLKVVTINGVPPSTNIETFIEYDNALNPYYKLPDFIGLPYFTQNNITKIRNVFGEQVRVDETTFEYYDNALAKKSSSKETQGEFISNFAYNCN